MYFLQSCRSIEDVADPFNARVQTVFSLSNWRGIGQRDQAFSDFKRRHFGKNWCAKRRPDNIATKG